MEAILCFAETIVEEDCIDALTPELKSYRWPKSSIRGIMGIGKWSLRRSQPQIVISEGKMLLSLLIRSANDTVLDFSGKVDRSSTVCVIVQS